MNQLEKIGLGISLLMSSAEQNLFGNSYPVARAIHFPNIIATGKCTTEILMGQFFSRFVVMTFCFSEINL